MQRAPGAARVRSGALRQRPEPARTHGPGSDDRSSCWSSESSSDLQRLRSRSGPHKFSAVTIDSRTVAPGSLFQVAVRGERQDGHSFIGRCRRRRHRTLWRATAMTPFSGAPAGITSSPSRIPWSPCQIARGSPRRSRSPLAWCVVAVTGSSGKTTTKDLIAAALTAHVSDPSEVLKTDGNLNNHPAKKPLTFAPARPGQRYAVVRNRGMPARGEIASPTSGWRGRMSASSPTSTSAPGVASDRSTISPRPKARAYRFA